MKVSRLILIGAAACSVFTSLNSLLAQGTAFTYQGRLSKGGTGANGVYDLSFALFQYDTGGNVILGPITNLAVGVSNALFTTLLDFGPYSPEAYGRGRWLEISVRTNGPGPFTVLGPRQPMTPAPSAIYAAYAAAPAPGTGFNADLIDGLDSSAFWKLGGNSNTAAAVLGTLDNNALELQANGARGLRIEPTTFGINFIAGNANNSIASNSVVSAIGGGTLNNILSSAFGSTIAGGDINTIQNGAAESVISGGIQNIVGTSSLRSVIAGGLFNRIGSNAVYSVISGGRNNRLTNDCSYATIGGGWTNVIEAGSEAATISGGSVNFVSATSPGAVIGGGRTNSIGASSEGATVAGGEHNTIGDFCFSATIGGGSLNSIGYPAAGATIAGGIANIIEAYTFQAVIGGGYVNQIFATADNAVIAGGYSNEARGSRGVVPGGSYNRANGAHSFAAGYEAEALHDGCFVWSDTPSSLFTPTARSTSSNQFIIRALGGVGIGVNDPQQSLSVAAGLNIDQANAGFGTLGNGLTFGSVSGEGIASKRTAGGNQYGLDFYSNYAKRMSILNTGNVGIGTDLPSQKLHVIGNIFATGTITPNSDRNQKTAFAPVDVSAVLDEVMRLPIQQWRFKCEPKNVKHVGPMAQDFHAAFGLGEIPTAIATVDADGVALAAIQGLNQKLDEQKAELRAKDNRISELEHRLSALEKLLQTHGR